MTWIEPVAHDMSRVDAPSGDPGLRRLADVATRHGVGTMAARLGELQELLAADLGAFEAALATLRRGDARVQRSAFHLLDLGGKRLRPMCVILASKLGSGFAAPAREIAIAVELVHAATLLHDDVVDLGERRRGADAARTLYGNATSVFAGDWLLIEALRRVRRARIEGTFDRLLEVIDEMILAESIQLDARGTLDLSRSQWLEVVEGKTAALFRWAMWAGGRAGGLSEHDCAALEDFGMNLGVAFQAVDDALDVAGDPATTGKDLFSDLREGKMTLPLILGLERDSELRAAIEATVAADRGIEPALQRRIQASLRDTGAIADAMALAEARKNNAVDALARFPASDAREALVTAAHAAVQRAK